MDIDFTSGKTVGRYRVISLLGEGGMGAVYKAFDLTLQRDVALKIMHAQFACQADFQERFLQEARTAARLDHPGIVQVHDFGAYIGQLYIVMEFIPGDNLGQILSRLRTANRWILLSEAAGIIRQVALALDYAHKHGVLHRDIKPDNIMLKLELSGNLPFLPVITDLGLVKLVEGGVMTQEGASMGTPAYMSPEQALGQPGDARSDVYSLGILLYELATAHLPFRTHSIAEAIRCHTQSPPPSPRTMRPELPVELEQIILKALQKDPAARFATAGDLSQALEAVLSLSNQVSEQKTSLGETITLVTQYQKSLVEQRGASILKEFPPPSNSSQDHIQVLSGGKATLSAPVKTSGMSIGRRENSDIRLDDVKVSRDHARIEFDGKNYFVVDMDSTNGTFLDNTRLLPGIRAPLLDNQVVRISSFWLRLTRTPTQAAAQVLPAGPSVPRLPLACLAAEPADANTEEPGWLPLANDQYSVDPGSSLAIPVILANHSDSFVHYTMTVSGISVAWIESLPQSVRLLPGENTVVVLNIRPPRNSTARAGNYAVHLNLTGGDMNQRKAYAAFTLVVNPFVQFRCTLHPEKVRMGEAARLTVQNQGNIPETFSLKWRDRAEAIIFNPSHSQIQVPAGKTVEVMFRARPRQIRWFGGEQVVPFSIHVALQSGGNFLQAGEMVTHGMIPANGKLWRKQHKKQPKND